MGGQPEDEGSILAKAQRAFMDIKHALMRDEAAGSLTPAPGQDLAAYADLLLARFANPSLNHRLAQIAMDGSQKVPQRWLDTLAAHQREGRRCPAILTALAAWLVHVRGDGAPVSDPLADLLGAHGQVLPGTHPRRDLVAKTTLAQLPQQATDAALALQKAQHQLNQCSLTTASPLLLLIASGQRTENLSCQLIKQTHLQLHS